MLILETIHDIGDRIKYNGQKVIIVGRFYERRQLIDTKIGWWYHIRLGRYGQWIHCSQL